MCACLLTAGCSSRHPQAISGSELAQAETFPYYEVYWAGRSFAGSPLTAVDGRKSYNSSIGEGVYYGDCVQNNGPFATGSCRLPLQVTTVIYRVHSNATLGDQRNVVIRGVPATIYDEGRSIELYSGRVAIDIFSSTAGLALQAAELLQPLNAAGSAGRALPLPVYCPGLAGNVPAAVRRLLDLLPNHVCRLADERRAAASEAGS